MNKIALMCGLSLLLFFTPVVAEQWYGVAPADPAESVAVDSLMADVSGWENKILLVSGRITDVCTHRGCWAVFEKNGAMLRVKARDHSFALPADARGEALAHGVLKRVEVSADHARHLVEDDGADPEVLEQAYEYRLVAEGVYLRP